MVIGCEIVQSYGLVAGFCYNNPPVLFCQPSASLECWNSCKIIDSLKAFLRERSTSAALPASPLVNDIYCVEFVQKYRLVEGNFATTTIPNCSANPLHQ
jgi:hypothetical protein